MKRINLIYTINLIIIFVMSFINYRVIEYYNDCLMKTYTHNILMVIVPIFCMILFGISIGLIQFFKDINIEGKWIIDINRLIILGLPSLLIALLPLLVYIGVLPYYHIMNNKMLISQLFQVLLGYIILSSFHK